MSLTYPDVLSTAKELVDRHMELEDAADSLVAQSRSLYNQVEIMKQYEEDLSLLNNLTSERPRLALVAGIQQENKHITELRQENRELRIALEEQQNAIDLIMSKYRQQVAKLIDNRNLDEKLLKSIDTNTQMLKGNTDEINEMKFIIRSAIEMDESSVRREEEVMASLWKENRGLREMLQISGTYGSYNTKFFGAVMEDKAVQTENLKTPERSDSNNSRRDVSYSPPFNTSTPPSASS